MPNRREKKLKLAVVAMMLVAAVVSCKSTKQNLNKPAEPSTAPAPAPASQSPFELVESKVIATVSPFDHSRKEHRTKTEDCSACHKRANNDAKPVSEDGLNGLSDGDLEVQAAKASVDMTKFAAAKTKDKKSGSTAARVALIREQLQPA